MPDASIHQHYSSATGHWPDGRVTFTCDKCHQYVEQRWFTYTEDPVRPKPVEVCDDCHWTGGKHNPGVEH